VAIDDSAASRQAIEYAGRMKELIPSLGFTLFHVQPAISQFLVDEAKRSAHAQTELNSIAARNVEASRILLARYQEALVRAGAPEAAKACRPATEKIMQGTFQRKENCSR
jgi:hypothetical protein